MNRTPTPQQAAVFDAVTLTDSHIAVEAVAGAGKSTTAVGCTSLLPGKKIGFVAFNKHIAEELQGKLNGTATACTMHSLGYRAVRKAFPSVGSPDEGKPKRLLQGLRKDWFYENRRGGISCNQTAQATLALARLCKYTLAEETSYDAVAGLAEHYGVDLPADEEERFSACEAACDLLRACAADTATLDFDDMVWFPVRLNLPVERFDLLLVDEVQDLNRCQQALAVKASHGGRLVSIGDRRQSIMGFTGADPEAFPRLIGTMGSWPAGCLERPLTVTFRCPESHVALARRLVPQIQASPWAIDGTVSHVDPDDVRRHVAPGDLIVCRRNAPLVALAFALLSAGVPALLRGRDVGKGLLDLIDSLGCDTPVALRRNLNEWQDRELEKLDRKDAPESQFQAVRDRAECLKELAAGASTLAALRETIKGLFGDDPASARGKVLLSSVHRAKGLEADKVVIVEPHSMPLVLTCRQCRGSGSMPVGLTGHSVRCSACKGAGTRMRKWEYEQEINLLYVAVTRAKKELIFAGPLPTPLGGF